MKIGKNKPGQGDDVLKDIQGLYPTDTENSETVAPSEDQVVKTSFYPRQDQLDRLDDLAAEYNKRYRRQRKRIDRQDIIRYLIDHCDLSTLEDLKL